MADQVNFILKIFLQKKLFFFVIPNYPSDPLDRKKSNTILDYLIPNWICDLAIIHLVCKKNRRRLMHSQKCVALYQIDILIIQ